MLYRVGNLSRERLFKLLDVDMEPASKELHAVPTVILVALLSASVLASGYCLLKTRRAK
jgi:hypothetical protein